MYLLLTASIAGPKNVFCCQKKKKTFHEFHHFMTCRIVNKLMEIALLCKQTISSYLRCKQTISSYLRCKQTNSSYLISKKPFDQTLFQNNQNLSKFE